MNTTVNPSGKENTRLSDQQRDAASNEDVQISMPKTERPEGPFEHSGETSNWTKEEKEEKEQDQA